MLKKICLYFTLNIRWHAKKLKFYAELKVRLVHYFREQIRSGIGVTFLHRTLALRKCTYKEHGLQVNLLMMKCTYFYPYLQRYNGSKSEAEEHLRQELIAISYGQAMNINYDSCSTDY